MHLNLSFVILAFVLVTAAGPISRRTTHTPRTATLYSKRSNLSLRDENGKFNHAKAKLQVRRLTKKTAKLSSTVNNLQKKTFFDKLLDNQSSSEDCGNNPQSVCLNSTLDNGFTPAGFLSVGSPGQQFLEIFDTGSSDLLVPGLNCTTCVLAHNFYDPTKSSTSVSLNQTLQDGFGDSNTTSEAGITIFEAFKDTVTLGGISIEDVNLGVLTQETGELQTLLADGIFGLGLPPTSATHQNVNAVIKAWQQGKISQPEFSLAITGTHSELFMGGQNPSRFTGQTEFHPIVNSNGWIIGGGAMSSNIGVELNRLVTLIDSGTGAITAPPAEAGTFYSKISGSVLIDEADGIWTVPCSIIPNIQISFSWGGRNFPVDPDLLNLGQIGNDTENCVYGILGLDAQLGVPGQESNGWILGELFMRTVYSTFDFGAYRVGFSTLVD